MVSPGVVSEGAAYSAPNGATSQGPATTEPDVDPEDPIYQAMMAAAKAPPVVVPAVKEEQTIVEARPLARENSDRFFLHRLPCLSTSPLF